MTDEPPQTPPPSQPADEVEVPSHLPMERQADGRLVIDLMPLAPLPGECLDAPPDPFDPEIVVCRRTASSPRLGPPVGPEDDDGFAGAIPRARLKLSDTAAAEANATAPSVGGWNAQGGEVRLKIDF